MVSFLNLPWVPQDLILRNLTLIDIFKFSTLSKKSYAVAKRSKPRFESVQWNFRKEERFNRPSVYITFSDALSVSIEEIDPDFWSYRCSRKCHLKFDGVHINFDFHNHGVKILYSFVRDDTDPFEVISVRLLELVKVGVFKCKFMKCKVPPYVFKVTRCFNELSMFFGVTLTHDEARVLLEDITVDRLTLYPSVEDGFIHSKPIKHRNLHLINAPWFTDENLMNSNCETMYVGFARMTSAGLTRFFQKWRNGELPELRRLKFSSFKNQISLPEVPLNNGRQVLKDANGNRGVLEINGYSVEFDVVPK